MDTALLPLPVCTRIAIIGSGDVGLSLALAFSQHYTTVGFDICQETVARLSKQYTRQNLKFSTNPLHIASCTVYIVAVSTPIDTHNEPDFSCVVAASRRIGEHLKVGDVVIYESTMYPGGIEEKGIPALEKTSGLTCNRQFSVGCSPKCMQAGDDTDNVFNLGKITAGSNTWCAQWIDDLYSKISTKGTCKAPSIAVAEAAKLFEATQYDVNIALMNEWAILCEKWHLNARQVMDCCESSRGFLPFTPGLVGGHCSDVDPYYLIHQAHQQGYHPRLITAGRHINEQMGYYVADRIVKKMVRKAIQPKGARALILGFSAKENCADMRHTGVTDLVDGLQQWQIDVDLYDPCLDKKQAQALLDIPVLDDYPTPSSGYHVVVVAIAHEAFLSLDLAYFNTITTEDRVLFDIPGLYPASWVDDRL